MNIAKHHTRWTEAMQPHVPEPLLAVGSFTRAGEMMAGMVGFGSGAARVAMRHGARKKSAGLPQTVVAGLTAQHLYLWKFRTKYPTSRLKIKGDPAMLLHRSSFQVTIGGNDGFAHRVHFWLPQPDGSMQTFELDSSTMFGAQDLNTNLLSQLVAPAAPYLQQVPQP